MTLFNELKRRNVFRVGIAYVIAAWLIAQVLQLVFESFGTPAWVMKTVLALLATGLPFALFFAWAFEMTPDGIKREGEVDRSQSITHQTSRKLNSAIMGVLVVALAYFIFDKFVLDASRDAALVEATQQAVTEQEVTEQVAAQSEPDELGKSIAVLPFVNMSGDQENEYFSDGLSEELLNSLARIKELRVIGRTSSFAFKGKNIDLREIGQTLGVAHILEGSVRKAQNRVRITAQLIKTEDGSHMWSDTFDRELDDIFTIQEEIATRVAKELSLALLGDNAGQMVHTGTLNAQAYEAYLKGRYLFKRNPDELDIQDQAEQFFQRALDIDPDFTLALFGQFDVLSSRQRSGNIDYKEGAVRLRQLADNMIAMDPALPESQIARGRVAMIEGNWMEAETALNQALLLNPGNINTLDVLTGLMRVLKRTDKALEYAVKAEARDPLDIRSLVTLEQAYNSKDQCTEAENAARRALKLVPEANRVNFILGSCWMTVHGDYQKAIDLFNQEGLGFLRLSGLAIAYNKLGQQARAQEALDALIESEGVQASYQYGQIYSQWGEKEKALDALEKAWSIGDSGFILLNVDEFLDPLREEPRFIALMEKWRNPSSN